MNYGAVFVLMIFSAGAMQKQQYYSPSSLFSAVKTKDRIKVRTILEDIFFSEEAERTLPVLLEWQSSPQRRTPLLQAVIDDNIPAARMLVAAGANIFASDFTGVSCIRRSIEHNQTEMLKILICPPKKYQKRLELVFLSMLKSPKLNIPNIEVMNGVIEHLVNTNGTYMPKYKWLQELEAASRKAALGHPERADYVRFAQLYKQVARFFLNYHRQQDDEQRKSLMQNHTSATYWNTMPRELRDITVDFLQKKSQEEAAALVSIIQQMPEQ